MEFLKGVTSQGIDFLQWDRNFPNSQSIPSGPNNRGYGCKQLKALTPRVADLNNIQEIGT